MSTTTSKGTGNTTEAGGKVYQTVAEIIAERDAIKARDKIVSEACDNATAALSSMAAELAALKAECERLRGALADARRNAYIRGYMRGSSAATDAGIEVDYEHRRALAEAHAISYSEQFDDAALSRARGES